VRLDMSEFMERQTPWARLLGAPPATWATEGRRPAQPSDSGAALLPCCCSIEVGEGHPEVFQPVVQVLDDGPPHRFPGRTVDFRKHRLVVMTSKTWPKAPPSSSAPVRTQQDHEANLECRP